MDESRIPGSCLCGVVKFEVGPPFRTMLHCHCSRCRKATGTGHATNLVADPGRFRWLAGEELITRYDLPSAEVFSKWFCSRCGAPVPRLRRTGGMMIVPAGSLDGTVPIGASGHIFWDSRAPWACSSGDLPTYAEYPASW